MRREGSHGIGGSIGYGHNEDTGNASPVTPTSRLLPIMNRNIPSTSYSPLQRNAEPEYGGNAESARNNVEDNNMDDIATNAGLTASSNGVASSQSVPSMSSSTNAKKVIPVDNYKQ